MLTSKKIAAYSKIVAGLPDVPSPALSALQLKQWFDTAPEEMRVAFNALIDNLISTATGDSGAESIGIEPIVGVSAANVQGALEQLRLLINDATAGAIPDGSLGPAKLSFDPATQVELDAHVSDFTTHVEYALATGAANTYVVTLTPAPTSYVRGMAVSVEINALNTGVSTININGMGAKSIKKSNGNDVLAGNLKVGIIYTLRYNGTNFILQGEGGEYGTAVAADVLTGKTIGTDAGLVAGAVPVIGADTVGTAVNGTLTAGRLFIRPPQAYWGGLFYTYFDDPDFIAANILSGKDIFGLVGTLAPGKKSATGQTSTGGSVDLIVTGLSFTPSIILAMSTSRDQVAFYNKAFNATTSFTAANTVTMATNAITTPTTGNFTIKTLTTGTLFDWIAIE